MGKLYRQPGSPNWYFAVTINKRKIRRSTGTSDEETAQRYFAHFLEQYYREQKLGERPEYAYQDAVVKYAEYKANDKRTIDEDLRKLIALEPWLGDKLLSAIDADGVNDAIAAYDKAQRKDKDSTRARGPLSQATKNRYRAAVRHMLNLAATEWDWLVKVPKIRTVSEDRQDVDHEFSFLREHEAIRLIEHAPAHWQGPIRLALATGLRRSNVFQLRWRQVDLGRRTIVIPRSNYKGKRTLAVPLNEDAVAVLAEMAAGSEDYVFTYQGRPFTFTNANWKRVIKNAGLADWVTFHTLRHTWASWHIMNGTSTYELMQLGGWSSLKMVQRYAHLSTEHLQGAAANLPRFNAAGRLNAVKVQLKSGHSEKRKRRQ